MKVRETVNRFLDERDKKGIETYGETLDQASDEDYNWQDEVIAELLDGIQYAAKENIRLRKELHATRNRKGEIS